jgi:hypothetical protein
MSAAAVAQNFAWQTLVTGNDTATPSSKLALLYGSGTTAPAVTGLYIAPNGQITFAPGQTFPVTGSGGGTISGITTSSPLTGSGTTGSVALGLNEATLTNDITPSLEGTFNGVYPQLGTADTFTGADVFNGGLTANASTGPAAITGNGILGVTGVAGTTDIGTAVSGSATGNGFGGYFVNNSGDTAAVYATNNFTGAATAIETYMPYSNSTGIEATAAGTSSFALYGNTFAANSISVYGLAQANGATGVLGNSLGTTEGSGVLNIGVSGTASVGIGVLGSTGGTSNTGSLLQIDGYTAGVWGDTADVGAESALGGILGTADNQYAGLFRNQSTDFPTVYAVNTSSGGPTGLFKTLMASTATGTCGIGGNGDLSCTGQVKSLVSAGNGARKVETYATQSAENWMEDYGTGTMELGVAVVKIDSAFAETVSETPDYHVFITPNGDAEALYVINKTATSFEVRESKGGTSSLTFDYKIVARRRGYEAQRLVDVTERFNTEMKAGSIHREPGAVVKSATPQHAALGSHPRPLALQQLPVPHEPMNRPANTLTKP